jgi:hypothetical protein
VTEKRKTVVVPDDFETKKDDPVFPLAAFVGWDDEVMDGRDVSQPVCLDEEGRPVWAPRGLRVRL